MKYEKKNLFRNEYVNIIYSSDFFLNSTFLKLKFFKIYKLYRLIHLCIYIYIATMLIMRN